VNNVVTCAADPLPIHKVSAQRPAIVRMFVMVLNPSGQIGPQLPTSTALPVHSLIIMSLNTT